MCLGSRLGSWLLCPIPASTLPSQNLSISLLGVAGSNVSHPTPHHAAAYRSHCLIIQVWVTHVIRDTAHSSAEEFLPLHTLLGLG